AVLTLAPPRSPAAPSPGEPGNPGNPGNPGPPNPPPPRPAKGRSLEDLLESLKADDALGRSRALADLADHCKARGGHATFLAEQLTDEDGRVRAAAVEVLGHLGPLAKGAYPAILHVSENDAVAAVRKAAAAALEKVGRPTAADVPTLVA